MTDEIPKALIEVGERPFAEHQLELLRHNGLSRVVFCLGYRGEMVQEVFGDGQGVGMQIDYAFDAPILLGTGGALRNALPLLGNDFFVLYGDSYLDCDYAAVEQAYRASRKLGLMTVYRNHDQWDKSNILFQNGEIVSYDKVNPGPAMEHIDYGLGVLSAPAIEPYPRDTWIDLATVYQDLLDRGQLAGYEMAERFYEIGSKRGLEEVQEYLSRSSRGPHR
jgi:NDP-sugar pyrophosphorylase family protein